MAKKKPGKNKGSKPSKKAAGRGTPPDSHSMPPGFDRRAMEAVMRQLAARMEAEGLTEFSGPIDPGRMRPPPPRTPLDAAQQLVYDAFEASTSRERVALAHEALKISQDCADAYVLLAENARTPKEALPWYQQGLAAGERALGEQAFREHAGHFWGLLETRPYMRARKGLAEALWQERQHEEATEHYREMLRLNPGDNQGIRYLLVHALLELERHEELRGLLERYEDDASAEWAYTAALLAFREEGDTERSRRFLDEARKTNPHVPKYLAGAQPMPSELPPYISPGDEDEAVSYAAQFLPAWKNTSGATAWLRTTLKVPAGQPPRRRRMNWSAVRSLLAGLPQAGEVWQVDIRPFPAPGGKGNRGPQGNSWVLCIVDASGEETIAFHLLDERPQPQEVWKALVEAMAKPEEGDPHRPSRIEVRLKSFYAAWQSKLAQIGVKCRVRTELEHVDRATRDLGRSAAMRQQLSADAADAGEIADLPQSPGEIWQADARQLDAWISVAGQPQRPWVALVVNTTEDLVLATDLAEGKPAADQLGRILHKAIARPAAGEPHRPGVVEFASDECREAAGAELEAAGVRCVVADRLEGLDRVLEDLTGHLAGPRRLQPLLASPGATAERVGKFFEAAADFYRAAPWRRIPSETIIEIECGKFQSGPWYAVVMGQSGIELGLALYEDRELLCDLISGEAGEDEGGRRTSGMSVTYGEAFDIAPGDLDAAEQHGWPVAGPEAYPIAMRVNPGLAIRSPLIWELDLLEACLRVIPQFVKQEARELSQTVPAASGELALRLKRIDA